MCSIINNEISLCCSSVYNSRWLKSRTENYISHHLFWLSIVFKVTRSRRRHDNSALIFWFGWPEGRRARSRGGPRAVGRIRRRRHSAPGNDPYVRWYHPHAGRPIPVQGLVHAWLRTTTDQRSRSSDAVRISYSSCLSGLYYVSCNCKVIIIHIASLTPSTSDVPNCCCSKGLAPWSNPLFLIFDIRALWRSILSARMSKIKNSGLD